MPFQLHKHSDTADRQTTTDGWPAYNRRLAQVAFQCSAVPKLPCVVNLKAELEVRSLHQKIDLLLEEQIKVLFDSQAKQLEILNRIEAKLVTR